MFASLRKRISPDEVRNKGIQGNRGESQMFNLWKPKHLMSYTIAKYVNEQFSSKLQQDQQQLHRPARSNLSVLPYFQPKYRVKTKINDKQLLSTDSFKKSLMETFAS